MSTCPAGHQSTASDYCDVCGLPVDAGAQAANPPTLVDPVPDTGSLAVPPAGAPAPPSGECPNCHAVNPVDALFCEACGYDFTTGTPPRQGDPTPAAETPESPDTPAAPDVVVPAVEGNATPPPSDSWVAEVWIDPDWYAHEQSTDPLPSPGLPTVVQLRHTSILIGRVSRSRGIHPDLDLGSDSGISRRHAQLTTDGSRWFVEDLGSSNGTYVADSVGPLPADPIPVGQKHEIASDERVYLGAWTRIVIRRAAPGEV